MRNSFRKKMLSQAQASVPVKLILIPPKTGSYIWEVKEEKTASTKIIRNIETRLQLQFGSHQDIFLFIIETWIKKENILKHQQTSPLAAPYD